MPYIPHTEEDIKSMLGTIGVSSINDLFDEIPAALRNDTLDRVPSQMSEMAVARLMSERANKDGMPLCFAGAGAYEHHIPAAVWEIATRGEFYSAYTPYQAEASQGTLQLIYEYQSMISSLTGLDVSNASLYDGATGLAEAILMAVRANRKSKSKRILMPRTVHPSYRKVANTIVKNQGIVIEEIDYDRSRGIVDVASLPAEPGDFTALVIPQPNFFGCLEDVNALTDWAHSHNALVIGITNPTSLALLTPPGEWGQDGADIACGDGQPLGIPLSSGGPYFGFLCCKIEHVRQMPGRIVGRTVDLDGKPGFTLTLQAREQHIRRSKATSNICTNQGLMVTAATIYMSIMGPDGLERTALASHQNTQTLINKLTQLNGVEAAFTPPFFHEQVIKIKGDAKALLCKLAGQNIVGGYALEDEYPELENAILVCATETKSQADIDSFVDAIQSAL
ncbi:MAG: aminomethyl-transferring glycine dehydrogenase subunit GcvPA [Gammaproteobacteria bacterium]|nr:aminomethyl-transferring glycine dehydrogenase subunit GcvPA [Gammaproteobacteria bacterium]